MQAPIVRHPLPQREFTPIIPFGQILTIFADSAAESWHLAAYSLFLHTAHESRENMDEIIQLDSIRKYNDLNGLKTIHPLVSVVDLRDATKRISNARLNYGLYALFIKHGAGCKIRYGMQSYDYQEGTVVSFAPGQLVQVEAGTNDIKPDVRGLLFHPDLIHGTSLARNMSKYSYFSYAQNEALHVSEAEQQILLDCLENIRREMEFPVDKHSRELLCVHIELFLEYCLRFYDRQFFTRSKVNSDVLQTFESELNDYYLNGRAQNNGLPSVRYFADKACLSPGYFGDLIKKETGKTAQEYIQLKIINLSKHHLLGGNSTVNEIADLLGFQYPQHFIRMFKKETGVTPTEFRKNN